MAGPKAWRFTLFIGLVLLAALCFGFVMVVEGPADPGQKLYAGAVASSLSAGILLLLSWWMSGELPFVRDRQKEWTVVLVGGSFIIIGLVYQTFWWLFGLPLFFFTKQGWRAVRSTLD